MIFRSIGFILEFVAGVVIGAAILLALVIWRLSGEPVSLAFLTPYFQEALSAEDGAFAVRLDDTVLTWAGWERTVDIRLKGVRAIGPDGATIAMVPEMSVSISGRALLRGIVAPTSIEVMGADLWAARAADGEFEIGLGGSGERAAEITARLLTDLLAPPHRDRAMGYLSRVSVVGARVTVIDEKYKTSWFAPRADVTLLRDTAGVTGDLAFDLDVGGELADFEVELDYNIDARRIELGAIFSNLDPARLATKGPLFAALGDIAMPVGGTLAASVDLDGRVEVLGFDLTAGPGSVRLPALYDEPLPVKLALARGRLEENLSRLVIDDVFLDLGGPTLSVSGRLAQVGRDVALQGEAVLRNMPLDSFERYWPAAVAPDPRRWVVSHMSRGMVEEARAFFAVLLPEGQAAEARLETIAGTTRFSGISVDYLAPMPAVTEVGGSLAYTSERIDFDFTGGKLNGLVVDGGSLAVTGLEAVDQDAEIELLVRGSIADMLTVLDHEPLGAARFLGLAPATVGGEIAARLALRFPLRHDLLLDHVELAAAGNMRAVRLPAIALGRDLTDGALLLKVDKEGMDFEGTARLAGVPVKLTGTETFEDAPAFRSRYTIEARVDDGDLARLGFAAAPYLTGPVAMKLDYTVMDAGRGELAIAADLKDAALELPGIDWSKAEGVAGTARLSVALENGRPTRLRDFALAAGDLTAAGSAVFAAAGEGATAAAPALERVDLTRLTFGRNDVRGMIVLRADGGYDVELRGPVMDAARFFARGEEGKAEEEEELPAMRLLAKTERLWVSPQRHVVNADLSIVYDGETWRKLTFKGRMNGTRDQGGTFQIRIVPGKGAQRGVTVTSDNAGAFLSTFGYFENLTGGTLALTGRIDDGAPGRPLDGKLEINDYRLINAPLLAELLTAATLTGIVNLLSGEGIGFAELDAEFETRDELLKIREATAHGPELGFTIKGEINLGTDVADLEGTLVPAYAINAFLGKIPLVGGLFTGEEGSGVFAATYRMRGPMDDPKITVNPLAALTPGFLRKVFGIFEGPKPGEKDGRPPPELPAWPATPTPAE